LTRATGWHGFSASSSGRGHLSVFWVSACAVCWAVGSLSFIAPLSYLLRSCSPFLMPASPIGGLSSVHRCWLMVRRYGRSSARSCHLLATDVLVTSWTAGVTLVRVCPVFGALRDVLLDSRVVVVWSAPPLPSSRPPPQRRDMVRPGIRCCHEAFGAGVLGRRVSQSRRHFHRLRSPGCFPGFPAQCTPVGAGGGRWRIKFLTAACSGVLGVGHVWWLRSGGAGCWSGLSRLLSGFFCRRPGWNTGLFLSRFTWCSIAGPSAPPRRATRHARRGAVW